MNQEVSFSIANVRPLDDRILLLRLPDLKNGSAIIVPEMAQKPSHRGKVVRTGPGKWFPTGWRRPMAIHMDDIVHYQSCDADDGTFVLIQEGDVLGLE